MTTQGKRGKKVTKWRVQILESGVGRAGLVEVVSLREGVREGCRSQEVTKLVGTEGESVVGTRWVPREGRW